MADISKDGKLQLSELRWLLRIVQRGILALRRACALPGRVSCPANPIVDRHAPEPSCTCTNMHFGY